jgi:hypothetical protein
MAEVFTPAAPAISRVVVFGFFVFEIIVYGGGIHTRCTGDISSRGFFETFFNEQLRSDVTDLFSLLRFAHA